MSYIQQLNTLDVYPSPDARLFSSIEGTLSRVQKVLREDGLYVLEV